MRQPSRILTALTLSFIFAAGGCNQKSGTGANVAPPNPIDLKIDKYEKVANEYVRVAKKLKDGDVSITVKYLELGTATQRDSAELSKEAPKMTPQQAQRVAEISAKTAPYFKR